jgi:hypothetical protein
MTPAVAAIASRLPQSSAGANCMPPSKLSVDESTPRYLPKNMKSTMATPTSIHKTFSKATLPFGLASQ